MQREQRHVILHIGTQVQREQRDVALHIGTQVQREQRDVALHIGTQVQREQRHVILHIGTQVQREQRDVALHIGTQVQREQRDVALHIGTQVQREQTRYLTSWFMGGAKAEQILKKFEDGILHLKPEEFLQTSSDGPNVNLKFLQQFNEKREFNQLPPLIDIGTCGLHTVHGSMKADVKKSGWTLGKIMKAMWTILDESPARRDTYESITESNVYPLQYCGHRRCENELCANRAEIVWHGFIKFMKFLKAQSTALQPKGTNPPAAID